MRAVKLSLIILSLGFAAMVYGIHGSGRFFPWVHGFALLSGFIFVSLAINANDQDVAVLLGIIVGTSVALRVFIYSWPTSMIGMDPDKYAAGVNRILQTGTIDIIATELPTYAALSLIYEFNSWVSIIAGIKGDAVLIGIPISMGAIIPLTATAMARRTGVSINYSLLAGVLSTYIAAGILFSYWPVAQTMAVLVWFTMLLLFVIVLDTDSRWGKVGALFCVPAIFYAHKISLLVPLMVVAAAIAAYILRGHLRSDINDKISQNDSFPRLGIYLVLLSFCLGLQWLFITEFGRSAILRAVLPLLSGGVSVAPQPPTYEAAVRGAPGIRGILIRRIHLLTLIPLVSLAGAWVWLRYQGETIALLVAAAAVPVSLAVVSIVGTDVAAPRRVILFGIPVYAVLIMMASQHGLDRIPVSPQTLVILIAVPLLITQVAGAPIAPDYPDEPRVYLTQGEIEGKQFAVAVSEQEVAMDYFYAREQTDVASEEASISGGREVNILGVIALNEPLLNATLLNEGYGAILLRSDPGVIRFSQGGFRLTWDPIEAADGSEGYNRFYDNGDAVGFSRI